MTTADGTSATPAAKPRSPRRTTKRKAGATIAVTGAAGVIGTELLRRLVAHPDVVKVVAIDVRRGAVDGPVWKVGDVREEILGLLEPYYGVLEDELERHGGTVEKHIGDLAKNRDLSRFIL